MPHHYFQFDTIYHTPLKHSRQGPAYFPKSFCTYTSMFSAWVQNDPQTFDFLTGYLYFMHLYVRIKELTPHIGGAGGAWECT